MKPVSGLATPLKEHVITRNTGSAYPHNDLVEATLSSQIAMESPHSHSSIPQVVVAVLFLNRTINIFSAARRTIQDASAFTFPAMTLTYASLHPRALSPVNVVFRRFCSTSPGVPDTGP
ncbi:hypothetical protein OPT61_g5527 [Boeremia exigua]|uniref:Uncharacterized protein n=1 Tax=Boeremia exigua TaxID=749465 RepID=A0ACC2IA89_9PLEO|nr:hypothetical protein OPT61_g5527 [Boeremia exigua]